MGSRIPTDRRQTSWLFTSVDAREFELRTIQNKSSKRSGRDFTVILFSQQLPTFLLLRDRRNVAQQCWIRLHSSSNIVGATHAHHAWFTKTYGLYPSHDALQVPTLLGIDASVCTPLPTRSQQLPTLLRQQCWELLRPFARSLRPFLIFGGACTWRGLFSEFYGMFMWDLQYLEVEMGRSK